MVDQCPRVCETVLDQHTDEVLFVSFSRCGQLFVTCSKDGFFIIWKITRSGTAEPRHIQDMKVHGWIYTWAAKFNKSSTKLLVAGVFDEVDGGVAVFDVSGDVPSLLQLHVNNPYDVMGSWCDEHTWLCGNLSPNIDEFGGLDAEIRLSSVSRPRPLSSRSTDTPDLNYGHYDLYFADNNDVVLRLRPPFNDGSNYLRCLTVTTTPVLTNHQPKNNVVSRIVQKPCYQSRCALENDDKTLIFLCSSSTTSPHQIGFKRLSEDDAENIPVISEPDHVIDMLGHIVGIALDTTEQYLFVNVRRWPPGAEPRRDNPPAIATEIELRVLELSSLRFLDVNYTGHKGYTDSTGAFYIYLDTNSSLVCSGSEDNAAYVWDRRFGCLLSRNTHDNVVNCVAFNPQDPEMLVSVGDDMKVKIWISKQRERELRLTESPHKRTKTFTE